MAGHPKYRVDLYLNPRHDHYHFSKIYSGLDVLARQKVICLRIKTRIRSGQHAGRARDRAGERPWPLGRV